jgi:MFS family permease
MLLSFLLPKLKTVWHLSDGVDGTIGAVVFAGMSTGAFIWGPFADRYGRKKGYISVAIFVGTFGVCSAVAPNLIALLIFRFGVGIGIGGANIPYGLFAEFLPTARRGAGMLVNQMWWTVGTIIECGLAWITLGTESDSDTNSDSVSDNHSWRYLLFYSTLPIMALYPLIWWLPESPRYLMVHGEHDAAYAILKRISRDNGRPLPSGTLVLSKSLTSGAAVHVNSVMVVTNSNSHSHSHLHSAGAADSNYIAPGTVADATPALVPNANKATASDRESPTLPLLHATDRRISSSASRTGTVNTTYDSALSPSALLPTSSTVSSTGKLRTKPHPPLPFEGLIELVCTCERNVSFTDLDMLPARR